MVICYYSIEISGNMLFIKYLCYNMWVLVINCHPVCGRKRTRFSTPNFGFNNFADTHHACTRMCLWAMYCLSFIYHLIQNSVPAWSGVCLRSSVGVCGCDVWVCMSVRVIMSKTISFISCFSPPFRRSYTQPTQHAHATPIPSRATCIHLRARCGTRTHVT